MPVRPLIRSIRLHHRFLLGLSSIVSICTDAILSNYWYGVRQTDRKRPSGLLAAARITVPSRRSRQVTTFKAAFVV